MERRLETSAIQDIGRWSERWRYKRLPPSEWGPRRRALGPSLGPLYDPSTVGVEDWDEIAWGPLPSELA